MLPAFSCAGSHAHGSQVTSSGNVTPRRTQKLLGLCEVVIEKSAPDINRQPL